MAFLRIFNIKQTWQNDVLIYRRAYMLTVVASFGGMLYGWDTGLIGGVLTMQSFRDSFGLDAHSTDYANLSGNIVSTLQAGCFFGAMSSFYVSNTHGRKNALLFADTIFLIGSLVQTTCAIGAHKGLAQLYVGRAIGGFGVGLISAVVPTYIGESVDKEIRGRCVGCMQLFNVAGIMISFFVNYGITQNTPDTSSAQWRVPFALQILPGLLLLVGLCFQYESPRWLVERNRLLDARKALAFVRAKASDDPTVESELADIVHSNGREKPSFYAQLRSICSSRETMYTFTLAIILMFWQQATGTNAINYYVPQVLGAVGLTSQKSSLLATSIYGVVKVVVTALGLMFATEQLGRKWSLIIGATGQAFAMYYIGINEAIHPVRQGATTLDGNNIFALVCVYLYVVFFSFGWGPIPYVLSAECSPNHVRSLVMAAALMTQWLVNFVIAKITPIMLQDITYGTFLIFGTCCVLMVIYTIVCVPETKGIPLEFISQLFVEGSIIKGAIRDTIPKYSRARTLQHASSEREESLHGDDAKTGTSKIVAALQEDCEANTHRASESRRW
ncbi:general substrate transporter [Polychaeton citri CBS 116435]|uniref:General substrate transporter n=1 Tax=Polychaeton citri CBS 116435 TaxID=1314669 RepID=A0A9P4Q4Y6_9PEZI|nr:general substrate transporter [Polychaeton citri CBS 116435]